MNRFLSLEDLEHVPPPTWMVENLFEVGSLVMLAGPSYAFKSFLLLDWLLSMPSGRTWNNRTTKPGKIAYVLGEGKSSLLKRIRAWIQHNRLSPAEVELLHTNFKVTFDVVQMASRDSVDQMLADIHDEQFTPDVIAIDTFARSLVGMDENDARDTGMWIESADRLRQLGYTVLFLHHTKKNTELGVQYRGSSAIIGAMDTAMTLVRDGATCTLTVVKQKDHDEGSPIRFRRRLIRFLDGGQSCVLDLIPDDPRAGDAEAVGDDPNAPAAPPSVDVSNVTAGLIADTGFASDRARARELATRTGLTEAAAQTRIRRARGLDGGESSGESPIGEQR